MSEKENNLAKIRSEYLNGRLDEDSVADDPVMQFRRWMNEAIHCEIVHPTAMILATATMEGKPSARVVLLKDVGEEGFTFFTDYTSRKGDDITENPQVALTFFWNELERQVRIEGTARVVADEISENYFHSRPFESKLSAAATRQSREVPDRKYLEAQRDALRKELNGHEVPRPAQWGGYLVVPRRVEFWQGRENRLHDRLVYVRKAEEWKLIRLSP